MKLIDLLVRDLPERGGWPQGVEEIWQDYNRLIRAGGASWFVDELSEGYRRKHFDATMKIGRRQYEAALAAASKPVWDGEGLPPVGFNCFVSCEDHADHEWIKIKVVHVHNGEVIGVVDMPGESIHDQISKYSKDYNRAFFIPIPIEAERKREAAVNKILDLMGIHRGSRTRESLNDIYNWISEGKIPGVRLDDEAIR